MIPLRSVLANNPGPFTHEGTRTFIVGRRRVAVLDPGPDLPDHVQAIAREVAHAEAVTVILTHGHRDHAGGLESLLKEIHPTGVAGSGHPAARPLSDGEPVETDAGTLVTVHTPGHTSDHLCFHWVEQGSLFAGDMVLGAGDTTWVAEYPGCVADWLRSLSRLEGLPLRTVYPAHGPDVHDTGALWARYRNHREGRISRVRQALQDRPGAPPEEVLQRVYGDTIPRGLRAAALQSLTALMEYVADHPGSAP